MANWRNFGDRMLYYHRSMRKTWCNWSNPISFHNSCTGGGGLLLGGGCFKKVANFLPIRHCCCCCSSSPSVSPRSLSLSPLLLVPPRVVVHHENSEILYSEEDYFNFFSLSEQKEFRVRKNLSIPWQRDLLTPESAPCVGSSHGWLVFYHPLNCHPYLYNPFIESPHFPYIPLPSVETLPSVCGVRLFKSDQFSPSPSLITRLLILPNIKEDTLELNVDSEDAFAFNVRRLVMSSAPSVPFYSSSSKPELDDDCTIMAIHCGGSSIIAFCKPGDERWTLLDGSIPPYTDIIYFSKDQRFYAMRSDCSSIEAWDLRDPSCPKNEVFDGPSSSCPGKLRDKLVASYNCSERHYLVESSGDLLVLSRFIAVSGIPHPRRLEEKAVNNNDDEERENDLLHDDDAYWTLGFDVRKYDFNNKQWERVECLGDQVLFVGSNSSFSLSTRDYPELKENSIYFTDHHFIGFNEIYSGHDNGVFHLEDNSIKPYYPNRSKIIYPHPIWVAPNPV